MCSAVSRVGRGASTRRAQSNCALERDEQSGNARQRVPQRTGNEVSIELVQSESAAQWAVARRLVEEYAASLRLDLGFQNFDSEVNNLASEYRPPEGAFLLAEHSSGFLGCVALRRFSAGVCEMKRLYVVPAGRGHGLGRTLAEGIIAQGRRLGYQRMLLDTLEFMKEAHTLYVSLGFRQTSAYRFNPIPGSSFLELQL